MEQEGKARGKKGKRKRKVKLEVKKRIGREGEGNKRNEGIRNGEGGKAKLE